MAIGKKAAVEALKGALGIRAIMLIKFNPDKTSQFIPNRSTTVEEIIREIKDTKASKMMGLQRQILGSRSTLSPRQSNV